MDNTLLVSLSHQLAAYRSMDVIADNLANADTPAFKRETPTFQEYVQQVQPGEGDTGGAQTISFVKDAGNVRDLSQGHATTTNAPLDLAVNGKGYFTVSTANGMRYTRNGHFTMDAAGRVVTQAGDPLQGDGGDITVAPEDGDIHIAEDGTVSGLKGQIGKVKLVNFDDESAMTKQGSSLYATSQDPKDVEAPSIHQGMLESSNVQPVLEISHMIEVMRAYQATSNLTQSQEDLMRNAIDKLSSTQN